MKYQRLNRPFYGDVIEHAMEIQYPLFIAYIPPSTISFNYLYNYDILVRIVICLRVKNYILLFENEVRLSMYSAMYYS